MKISFVVIFFVFLSFMDLLQCQEGNETEPRRKCREPKAPIGRFTNKGCMRYKCVKAPWRNFPSGAKWKAKGLNPDICCLADGEGYPTGSVIMTNDTVPLVCENVDGVPSLRILLDNMCSTTAITSQACPTCPALTCPSTPPCPTCPTTPPSTSCPSSPPCPTCPPNPPALTCPPTQASAPQVPGWAIELRGGSTEFVSGNLYIYGHPVCDDYWDNVDARVACRMLGYSSGFRTWRSEFGSVSSYDFIMDNVRCTGSESNLLDCEYLSTDNCGTTEGAGVMCNALSLQGGSAAYEGNLFIQGQPVCDDAWNDNDAIVACRMHGYENGIAKHYSHFGTVPDDFIMDDLACSGSEQTLFDCTYTSSDNCGGHEGAGVICTTATLQGGSSSEGNLFINGQPVCDDAWDDNDAAVACRMLGFSTGTRTMFSAYGSVPTNFIMDDVQCSGSEQNLFSCTFNPSHNCGSGEGAGVVCQGSRNVVIENTEEDKNVTVVEKMDAEAAFTDDTVEEDKDLAAGEDKDVKGSLI